MKNCKLLVLLLICSFSIVAQKPTAPIPAEVMFGNNRANLLLILNRPIDANGKFNFFNVTAAAADYNSTPSETEIVLSNALTYSLGHNFYAAGGAQWHFKLGLVPIVGFQYLKASPEYLVVVFPTINLMPDTNAETVVLTEYKPLVSKTTRLYTRLQLLYNQDLTLSQHARSAYSIRAGFTFQKFTVGLGVNWDYYGPVKMAKSNTGLFFQMKL